MTMVDNKQKEGMLQVGTMLSNGKYRIDQYLASGGFGNTYVATDMAFNEKVAIKELFIDGICGRSSQGLDISISLTENKHKFSAHQEKFRKEARRLRKLNNPHIVKVHDLFDENQTSYYVMDFVEGESLSARLKRTQKPMIEADLLLILPQILDALECVHKEGIWHLDLKPANIMIDAKGNIQLIDFGASKQLKTINGVSLSTSSVLAYTRGYAPSEQMEQNMEKFGPWTDLYALGATMYNLLTMQEPPSPSDIEEDISALKLPSDISKKTSDLIIWLMKPVRKMRPQSVMDVKQFLIEATDVIHYDKPKKKDVAQTIIKPKEGKENSNSIHPLSESKITKSISNEVVKNIIITIAIIVCLFGGIFTVRFINHRTLTKQQEVVVDTTAVENRSVTVSYGPDNMRRYSYTGEWDNTAHLPQGKGLAKFAKYGDIPAATYMGLFKAGICTDNTGKAIMTFESGDKYIGSFENGYYIEGKYILSDKSYFEGTFKNGSPYNGKWFTASGKVDGVVVNGKEH